MPLELGDMPTIIKRYRNRKLYNVNTKRYITLDEIEGLIHNQEDVRVIDNVTGQDITSATFSQIIYGLEKDRVSILPVDMLFSLIRLGDRSFTEIRERLFDLLNSSDPYEREIERRIKLLVEKGELTRAEGANLVEKLMTSTGGVTTGKNERQRFDEYLKERQVLSKNNMRDLLNKIETISSKIDSLNKYDGMEREEQEN